MCKARKEYDINSYKYTKTDSVYNIVALKLVSCNIADNDKAKKYFRVNHLKNLYVRSAIFPDAF